MFGVTTSLLLAIATVLLANQLQAVHSSLVSVNSDEATDLQTVGNRIRQQYQGASSCGEVCASAVQDLATLQTNGSWADVDYNDQSRTVWKAMDHWNKVIAMVRAFNCPECTAGGYNSTNLLNGIFRACDFWIAQHFQDPNWWFNDIGMPMAAMQVYMLLAAGGPRGGVLTQQRIDAADLLWKGTQSVVETMTGENRIWTRTVLMQRGLLHANTSIVTAAFADLFSTVVLASSQGDDGIMPDGSFHQHGPLLQSGSYGGAFFLNVANLIYLAHDTQFGIQEERGLAYATFALDGEQWLLRTCVDVHVHACHRNRRALCVFLRAWRPREFPSFTYGSIWLWLVIHFVH